MSKPELINGGVASDDRGFLMFSNDFDPVKEGIRRVYIINNINDKVVRAFHGHLEESKYIMVLKGTVKFVLTEMMQQETPVPGKFDYALDSGDSTEYNLSDKVPRILKVPAGWANGMKSLTNDSVIIVFSNRTLDESKDDDIRFDWDELGEKIWETKNR